MTIQKKDIEDIYEHLFKTAAAIVAEGEQHAMIMHHWHKNDKGVMIPTKCTLFGNIHSAEDKDILGKAMRLPARCCYGE